MGVYNFESAPNRLGHHSVKWKRTEASPDLLPAWIADMDFEVLPQVADSIRDYAGQAIYGYNYASDGLFSAIEEWEEKEHGYVFPRESLVLMEGVVPSISTTIQAVTVEGDAVLINTPVYPPFARSVLLNKRRLVRNSLLEVEGRFEIDFEELERQFVEEDVKLYVLCSPHNPGGRVWEKDVLERIGRLCLKHGVLLVSDEIHQDLTLFGNKHVSFNTIAPDFKDFTIILSSATKTFNIAGTKNSFAIIENPVLRDAFTKKQLANNQHEISSLGLIATEVVFREGKAWLEELLGVLEGNVQFALDFFAARAPRVKVMKPEGTYLLWLDFSAYGWEDEELFRRLEEEAGVLLNHGSDFGKEGRSHARLNVACPRPLLEEILERIVRVLPESN